MVAIPHQRTHTTAKPEPEGTALQRAHERGLRRAQPMFPLNCSAFQRGGSRAKFWGVFGLKVAFTGAFRTARWRVRTCQRGTIFLYEGANAAGWTPNQAAAFLQRRIRARGILQTLKVRRASHRRPRIRDLQKDLRGTLSRRLCYRLNVFPSTSGRRATARDIPVLVQQFLEPCAAQFGKALKRNRSRP